MKIFLLTLRTSELKNEPWGKTISAVVRAASEYWAYRMVDDEGFPKELWDIEEIKTEGPETMIMSAEYGNI